MKNSKQDSKRNKFISSIIESIKMNVNEFMNNLANGETYETTIYEWSVNLFDEGKSIDDAIKAIQERRKIVIFNSADISSTREDLITARNHRRIMRELKSKPTYSSLNKKQKASIQKKIDGVVESKLRTHSEVIKLVLEIIKYNFEKNNISKTNTTKKSKNTIISNNIDSTTFLLKFKNRIHPKLILNKTLMLSSELS